MASGKQIRDEIMRMTIAVNSDPAQKEIYSLTQSIEEYRAKNKELIKTLAELEKQRKADQKSVDAYAEKLENLKRKKQQEAASVAEVIKTLRKQQQQYEEGSREYLRLQSKIDSAKQKGVINNKKLDASISEVTTSQRKLITSINKLEPEIDKLNKEIKENADVIAKSRDRVTELTKSLDVNRMTIAQLKKEAALLRSQLMHLVPKSPEAKELEERLQAINKRLNEVKESADDSSGSFSSLADKFNHYSGIIVAILGTLAGLTLSIQNVIDRNNKMADAMSAVEKTTGMAKSEVEDLTRAYADFDTRTNRIDLLKISEIGGRLGVPKEQIIDFTKEVDKAYVALGDSWEGGVDKLADTMGRIVSLYRETKDLPIAQSMNEVGSALNELAAQGASSEQNIADFVARLGSMPPAMKPPLNTLLGFGSAFEESNINSEIASSGFAKFVRVASTNASGFAKIMNQPVAKVKEMINTNPAEFFLQFSEGLKGLDGTQVSAVLDHLKLSDNEVQRVIGAATEKTDRFRESVDLASQAVLEGKSLQEEFNKVNNNAAGIYEKVQKKFAEAITSQKVAEFINDTVTAFGKFIGVVEDSEGTVTGFRDSLFFLSKLIAIIIATTVSYNLVTGVYNGLMRTAIERVLALTVVEKARNLVVKIGTTLNTLYTLGLALMGAAYALVTGNVAQATFAMRAFGAAIAANPLGLILTLVTAVSAAYMAFNDEAEETISLQSSLNNLKAEAAKKTIREKEELFSLLRIAKDENQTKEAREAAIKRINRISPEYLGHLTLEKIKTNEAADAVRAYVRELDKKALAEALFSKKVEIYKQREDIKAKGIDEYVGWENLGGVGSWAESKLNSGNLKRTMTNEEADAIDKMVQVVDIEKALAKYVPIVQQAYRKRRDELRENFKEQQLITKKQIEFEKENAKFVTDVNNDVTSNYVVPDPDAEAAKKAAKKAERERLAREKREKREAEQHEREMNQYRKYGEEAERVARETELGIQDATIEAMAEGFEKEIAQIDLQEQRKKLEIDKKKVSQVEFDILQKKIDSAKGDDKLFFEALKKSWTDNNSALEDYKNSLEEISANKRLAAKYKRDKKFISSNAEAHQESLNALQREYNEEVAKYTSLSDMRAALRGRISNHELNQIRTFADGKEALQRLYNKKEIDLQVAHLQEMMTFYEALDLTLLTDDQRKEVLKFIDEAGNKIAELKAKAAGQSQDQADKKTSNLGKESKVDILGLDQNQWITMFENLQTGTDMLGTMMGAVTALQNAFSMYYKFIEANEQRQLKTYERNTNRKKNQLKQQLDSGVINQETYNKLTLQSDNELEKRKAELSVKSAKRERAMQIANIIGNTALGIMKVWTDPGYPMAIPLSVVVGALGAVQLATVLNTPLPTAEGYEGGFNTINEEYPIMRQQDGKKFNVRRRKLKTGLVDRPTHFIAGENAVEMVIDNPTWTTYSPELKQAIYSANRRAKGFESGFNTQPTPDNLPTGSDDVMIMLINSLDKYNETMEDIKENGIPSYIIKSARNGKEINEMVEDSKKLDNKNKH